MLDMGWTEILIIGVVALIVVGPKDLPRMFRTLGQYAGKMRGMAREFQRSMDDAAREADLNEFKDIGQSLNDVRKIQSDAKGAIREGLTKIDKELEEADLDPGMVDDTPMDTKAAEPAKVEDPTARFSSTAAPVDKPDPSAGQAPPDPATEPEVAEAPAPKTASGG